MRVLAFLHGDPWVVLIWFAAAVLGGAFLIAVNLALFFLWLFGSKLPIYIPPAAYLVQIAIYSSLALGLEDSGIGLIAYVALIALTLPWIFLAWGILSYIPAFTFSGASGAGVILLCALLNSLAVFIFARLTRKLRTIRESG